MNCPKRLPLYGLCNPRGQLPSFLVPVFGTESDLWIQDSIGGDLVTQFSKCDSMVNFVSAKQYEMFQNVGMKLIYAFQFANEVAQIGSKESIQKYLLERFERVKKCTFLAVEVVNFIENVYLYTETIEAAKAKLAQRKISGRKNWQNFQKTPGERLVEEGATMLMASTIRGTVNCFFRAGLDLNLQVLPNLGEVKLRKGGEIMSLLVTEFRPPLNKCGRGRVSARIYINKDASRHLARFRIAAEIGNLLISLDLFVRDGGKAWPAMQASEKREDDCNLFALELCQRLDRFARNREFRERLVLFPPNAFVELFSPNENEKYLPQGIGLDPKNPFYSLPPFIGD